MKKANTPSGGAPSKITNNVIGTIIAVSSVPEISPIIVKIAAPRSANKRAIK